MIILYSNETTPLSILCKKMKLGLVKYLVENRANIKNETNGKVLIEACENNNSFKLVEYLLSKGIDPSITNDDISF